MRQTHRSVDHMAPFQDNPENVAFLASNLIKSTKAEDVEEHYWFPIPEDPGDNPYRTPIQRGILTETLNLQDLENLSPHDDPGSRRQFLTNFDWTDSKLQPHEIHHTEDLLVELTLL